MNGASENVEELQVPKINEGQRVSVQITAPLTVSDHGTQPAGGSDNPAAILRRYLENLPHHPSPKVEFMNSFFWRAIRSEFVATFLLTVITSAAAVQPLAKTPLCSEAPDETILIDGGESTTAAAADLPLQRCHQDSYGWTWALEWALAHGLVIGALTWAMGCVHFSLPTTLALFAAGKISITRTLAHLLTQILGSLVATPVLLGLLHRAPRAPVLAEGVSAAQGWGIEFLATFLVSLVSLSSYETPFGLSKISSLGRSVSVEDSHTPRIVYGALLPLVTVHISGALLTARFAGIGLNPARSLCIAILTNEWNHHWIWWVGPLLGGFIAAFTHEYTGTRDPRGGPSVTVTSTPRPSIIPREYGSRPSFLLPSSPASPS